MVCEGGARRCGHGGIASAPASRYDDIDDSGFVDQPAFTPNDNPDLHLPGPDLFQPNCEHDFFTLFFTEGVVDAIFTVKIHADAHIAERPCNTSTNG